MTVKKKAQIENALKVLEHEGLVFKGVTNYEQMRRETIRQLTARIKKYDTATTAFFNAHYQKEADHWDNDSSAEFFGRIRKTRAALYSSLHTLTPNPGVPAEWDSP